MIYQPMPIGRICRNCKEWKPRPELTKHKRMRDGIDLLCKKCSNLRSQQWGIDHKEKAKEYGRIYNAKHKKEQKDYNKQYQSDNRERINNKRAEYRDNNREELRKKACENYANNREKRIRQASEYQRTHQQAVKAKKHRRRAREKNTIATFTEIDWNNALIYWNNTCATCGRPQGLWHILAQDHWIPVTRGGGYTPDNIIPLCHGANGCNNSKHDRDPVEWLNDKFGKRKAKNILKRINEYFEWVKQQNS